EMWGAFKDGITIGSIIANIKEGEIFDVYVKENYQNKGIARALLREILLEFAKKSIKKVVSTVIVAHSLQDWLHLLKNGKFIKKVGENYKVDFELTPKNVAIISAYAKRDTEKKSSLSGSEGAYVNSLQYLSMIGVAGLAFMITLFVLKMVGIDTGITGVEGMFKIVMIPFFIIPVGMMFVVTSHPPTKKQDKKHHLNLERKGNKNIVPVRTAELLEDDGGSTSPFTYFGMLVAVVVLFYLFNPWGVVIVLLGVAGGINILSTRHKKEIIKILDNWQPNIKIDGAEIKKIGNNNTDEKELLERLVGKYSGYEMWGAFKDDITTGFIIANIKKGEIFHISMKEKYQNKGIARALLRKILLEFTKKGVKKVTSTTILDGSLEDWYHLLRTKEFFKKEGKWDIVNFELTSENVAVISADTEKESSLSGSEDANVNPLKYLTMISVAGLFGVLGFEMLLGLILAGIVLLLLGRIRQSNKTGKGDIENIEKEIVRLSKTYKEKSKAYIKARGNMRIELGDKTNDLFEKIRKLNRKRRELIEEKFSEKESFLSESEDANVSLWGYLRMMGVAGIAFVMILFVLKMMGIDTGIIGIEEIFAAGVVPFVIFPAGVMVNQKSNEEIKKEIFYLLEEARKNEYMNSGEIGDLGWEIESPSMSLDKLLENIKLFLFYRSEVIEKGIKVKGFYGTWPVDVRYNDFGKGFEWICVGEKPWVIEGQGVNKMYYYETIMKEGNLVAYGATELGEKHAFLSFRVLNNFIDEARQRGFSEYIVKKRLEFLRDNFPQIEQFRIRQNQIINNIVRRANWINTLVFYIKKCGFKPSGDYDENVYSKIITGGKITDKDFLLLFPLESDYLYRDTSEIVKEIENKMKQWEKFNLIPEC
ncbi:GNAT family N-acetyltransferase, partial [bacterium]|nr:GNAT family N-acetyltransferase [bacterium]